MGAFPRSRIAHTVGHPPPAASRTRNPTLNQFSFAPPFFPLPCQPPQQDWNLRIHPNSGTWEETLEGSHQNPAHEGEEENDGKVWVASYLPTGDKPTRHSLLWPRMGVR